MRRSGLDLEAIVDWRNLTAAFHAASRGKVDRPDVASFARNLDMELAALRAEIVSAEIRLGALKSFWIRDPKLRLIHAPCFRDRVLHHALMSLAGPELERALVFDTYACRIGKGTLAAVRRCQHHVRRFPFFAKIDIKAYFRSVDHKVLQALLARHFKNRGLLRVFSQIIAGYAVRPGKGLPIGALTSQHFANFYLSGLDRFILEAQKAKGFVRYMDDIVWWDENRTRLRDMLGVIEQFAKERLLLEVKQPTLIGRSRDGVMFCGLQVLPGALRLSRRRRKRYAQRRKFWERAYCCGAIDEGELQMGYGAALAITAHAAAAGWRREQLRRRPIAAPLQAI
jgi:hypothetical protein